GRVVLHLRAVGEPIAVGDLGDLESAVSQISVLHDLSLRPSRLLWNPRSESGPNIREVVSPGRDPAIPGSPSGTPEPAGAPAPSDGGQSLRVRGTHRCRAQASTGRRSLRCGRAACPRTLRRRLSADGESALRVRR